jgi:hypothetical protein
MVWGAGVGVFVGVGCEACDVGGSRLLRAALGAGERL